MKGLFIAAVLATFALGCAKKVAQPLEVVRETTTVVVEPPSEQEVLAKILRGATLHFDFDDSTLTEHAQNQLHVVAKALKPRPWASIRIAGHCDERGTAEYNLALGQKRADIARAYLVALGIDGERIETVSYGAEDPAQEGNDEAAWAQNRRDELHPIARDAIGFAD